MSEVETKWCEYRYDAIETMLGVDVFRYNTGKWNINTLEKGKETMIKSFHKAADK